MFENFSIYAIDAGIGDCVLIWIPVPNIKILIDAGPSMGRGRITTRTALTKLLKEDNVIDLAIVTHNDDDHIGGFDSLIMDKVIDVKTFIFNDATYIRQLFPPKDTKFSLRQGRELASTISDRNLSHMTFHNDSKSSTVKSYEYQGLMFEFLSPDEEKLANYNASIEKKVSAGDQKFSEDSDTRLSNEQFVQLMNDIRDCDRFVEDKSKSNGSSLAFSLKIGNHRFLFLGDSHPSTVVSALQKLGNPNFDLCKLSHHGSEKNTSSELISAIECQVFLLCGDGRNTHGHPAYETLARILICHPKARFLFSSDTPELKNRVANLPAETAFSEDGYLELRYA